MANVEPFKRADGSTYFRARIRLGDSTYARVDVPEKYATPAGGRTARQRAELYADALQEREDETGEILARKRARLAEEERKHRLTDGETCERYFARWNVVRRAKLPRQAAKDESAWRLWLSRELGAIPIQAVTRARLIELSHHLDEIAAKGEAFAEKRARNIFSVVAAMFRDAYSSKDSSLRVLDVNPMADVPWPDRGGAGALKQMLFPREFLALVSCPDVPILRARLYAVTLLTATRAAEVRVLSAEHVDIAYGSVRVVASDDPIATKATGKATTKATKSGKARLVTLEPTLAPVLAAMLEERDTGRLFLERPKGLPQANQWRPASTDYIPGPDGAYGLCGMFKRDLRTALESAGIDVRPELFDDSNRRASLSIRFHDLRASGISWRHARRDNPAVILQEVGHEDQATNEIYIRALRGLEAGELFPALPDRLLGASGAGAKLVPSSPGTPQKHRKLVGAEGLEEKDPAEIPTSRDRLASLGTSRVDVSARPVEAPVPSELHDARFDFGRAEALAKSIATLTAAGLAAQARPLAEELEAMIREARGPMASVTSLSARRPKG